MTEPSVQQQAMPFVPTRADAIPVDPNSTGAGRAKRDTYNIYVTEDDIRNAIRGSATHCPIALAIKRATPFKEVSVGGGASCNGFPMSLAAEHAEFVRRFDAGEPVEPIQFQMYIH